MKKKQFRVMASALILCWSFTTHASHVIVEIPGIPGESQRSGFEGAIDANGVSGSFAKNSCEKVVIMKAIDSASPLLIAAAVDVQTFSEITVSYRRSAGEAHFTVLTLRLLNSRIKSVETAVDEDDTVTVEEIAVKAANIVVEYQIINDDHSLGEVISTTLECRNQ